MASTTWGTGRVQLLGADNSLCCECAAVVPQLTEVPRQEPRAGQAAEVDDLHCTLSHAKSSVAHERNGQEYGYHFSFHLWSF